MTRPLRLASLDGKTVLTLETKPMERRAPPRQTRLDWTRHDASGAIWQPRPILTLKQAVASFLIGFPVFGLIFLLMAIGAK